MSKHCFKVFNLEHYKLLYILFSCIRIGLSERKIPFLKTKEGGYILWHT